MNWVTGLLVYIVTWWLVLFCVLPLGVRQNADVPEGHDPGAPANPRLGFKALLTTAIAGLVFGLIYLVVTSDLISFRNG
jgi:predicted secreted protein